VREGSGGLGVITIELPGALQPYAHGSSTVTVRDRCATVRDALTALADQHPGVLDRVMDEQGQVRPHVNVFVDERSIRFLDGLETPVGKGSVIVIVPAVSGG
jgi:molybdopterin converting factor small subunit